MKFYIPLIIRLVITIIILLCTNYWKTNYLFLFCLLIILDQIDCFISMALESNSIYDFTTKRCKSYDYQRNDKLGDLITYILVIILNEFTNENKFILTILTCWRAIGVYKFYNYNDNTILYNYPDTINSTILVAYLADKFPIIKENYYISILVGMLFKYKFERFHHKIKYT